eukprot:3272146-Amphidinium_carterae.1
MNYIATRRYPQNGFCMKRSFPLNMGLKGKAYKILKRRLLVTGPTFQCTPAVPRTMSGDVT